MRIKGIPLKMLRYRDIEAESGSDQWTLRFRIGISCQHPSFVSAVPKDSHQTLQAELDVGIFEIEERLR